ncbi:hypothetical protein CLOACE_09840 [Clostridium acetireducens DSM 10703]|jgi:hypothetical protein|uniref:DUF4351 domain-containing protein n=1 Tax=Clostridium acetireducens DSM 10703 TaxID=1121290 RepID=A0A1E8EZB6_9CLOT|nr:DUF4351 domain-containing protein [Clostridium acetireducens]OFI06484.1 hypothetical protein CLOACE_09840 [Clostridium acetireducens DSM 10703]
MDLKKIEDSIMKNAMDIFKQTAVDFFNLKTKIIAPANTELKTIDIKTSFTDYTFYTEDGNYLHFEFQTTNKEEDINRFLFYDASLFYKYGKKVNTLVVYSSDIKKSKTKVDAGCLKYEIDAFYMSSLDGDAAYNDLKMKIAKGDELTKKEILSLTFIPLMKGKEDKSTRTIKSIELAEHMKENTTKLQCITLLYAFLEKFGDAKSKKKFKEVFSMTEIGKMIIQESIEKGMEKGMKKGMEKGLQQGMQEGRKQELIRTSIKLLTKKFGVLPDEVKIKIENSDTTILEIIVDEILDFKKLEDVFKYLR